METLAYLHLAEEYENSEARELDLTSLKTKAAVGALAAACTVGVMSIADSASAYGYGGRHHSRHYYSYHCYSYCYYSYRPVYYYNPCW